MYFLITSTPNDTRFTGIEAQGDFVTYPNKIYFYEDEVVLSKIAYDCFIREVKVLDGVVKRFNSRCSASNVLIGPPKSIQDVLTWKWLSESGVNITNPVVLFLLPNLKTDLVKYIVDSGIQFDNYHLRNIISSCRLDVITYVFENGKGVDILEENAGFLLTAIHNRCLPVIKYLLSNGVNIHEDNDQAVISAAISDNQIILKCLVENGANIQAQENKALKLAAAYCSDVNTLDFLIKNGADIHANSDEPFKLTCHRCWDEGMRYFIEKGVDVHTGKDIALRTAAENDNMSLIKFLLDHGADINVLENYTFEMTYKDYFESIIKNERS